MEPQLMSKTINIHGGPLGGNPCSLTLAFVPPDADFGTVIPVAWKVITLTEGESFTYAWNAGFAASHVVVSSKTKTVDVDDYIPLARGQRTKVLLDRTEDPPEYSFTNPSAILKRRARVVNKTGELEVLDIGAGFITDLNQPSVAMNPIVVMRNLADKAHCNVDYTPTLMIWAGLSFAQSQLLGPSVITVPTLWQGTLTELSEPEIDITVKRVKGKLVADGPTSGMRSAALAVPHMMQLKSNGRPSTYSADLAFADAALVADGLRSIVKQLISQGYSAKLTQKGCNTEARLELTLPPTVSCNKAELDTVAAIDASPTTFGKAFIKAHSGAALVTAHNGLETWLAVNPATPRWFTL